MAVVGVVAGGLLAGAVPAVGAPALRFVDVWSAAVKDGGLITLSSPNVAVLNGSRAVVVGDQGGDVDAFALASGAPVPGWPASTGGVPVSSTPSVAVLGGAAPNDTVFVGVGSAGSAHEGGYEAFNPNGTKRWYVAVHNPGASYVSAVAASLAVGHLQGSPDVVGPSVGQEEDAINASTGAVLPGFPWFDGDGDFATPALADLYGNGETDIINGGGQTAAVAYGTKYPQGGHVRVVSPEGNKGTGKPAGGLLCDYDPDQEVDSSPAVGPFLAGAAEGIVAGTGNFWPGAAETDTVLAYTSHCKLVWSARLNGLTTSSPALANLSGSGKLEVVEGTDNQHGGGTVYALNGANGAIIWHQAAKGEVIGSVVTANLGAGYQDVIVSSTGGAEVLDGRSGAVLTTVGSGVVLESSALVTDDPNGTVGVTLAGFNAYRHGIVEHYELKGSRGSLVDETGSWPMFHHDPSLTGSSKTPLP